MEVKRRNVLCESSAEFPHVKKDFFFPKVRSVAIVRRSAVVVPSAWCGDYDYFVMSIKVKPKGL